MTSRPPALRAVMKRFATTSTFSFPDERRQDFLAACLSVTAVRLPADPQPKVFAREYRR